MEKNYLCGVITFEDIDILSREEVRAAILRNLDSDPTDVAMREKSYGALISTQVKYLQRARTKLPSYYAAGCLLEPLAFEQCSGEKAAASREYGGKLCVDLTCGLGVDSYRFSKKFERVIAVERSAELCALAEINFRKLGAGNIEVVNMSAEDFLRGFEGGADLIFVDPARRSESGGKLYLLEHCSPDVTEMMPDLKAKAEKVVVKASPLFDFKEAFRIFGCGITVEAISADGECKELIIEIKSGDDSGEGVLKASMAGKGSLWFSVEDGAQDDTAAGVKNILDPAQWNYLLIPDVSLYKMRLTGRYARQKGLTCFCENGYFFSENPPEDFFGRTVKIIETMPYQPKKLKKLLKSRGIVGADILKKDFPETSCDIAAGLGIREGGDIAIAFTRAEGKKYAIFVENLNSCQGK